VQVILQQTMLVLLILLTGRETGILSLKMSPPRAAAERQAAEYKFPLVICKGRIFT